MKKAKVIVEVESPDQLHFNFDVDINEEHTCAEEEKSE